MGKERDSTETEYWTAAQRDPLSWPKIPLKSIPTEHQALFKINQRALYLRLVSGLKLREISERTNLSIRKIQLLVERSNLKLDTGDIAGWVVCIPYFRIKPYTRTTEVRSNFAGSVKQFVRKHGMEKKFTLLAIGKVKINEAHLRGGYYEGVYLTFREMCIEKGVDVETEYPFTNYDEGREAVRNYVHKIREKFFVDEVRVLHGNKVAALAASSGKRYRNIARAPLPYECTQLDGHRLDAMITVTIRDGAGNKQFKQLSRIWLILHVDEASRAIVGYSVSLSENYSAQDVMNCFNKTLSHWSPIHSPNENPPYLEAAGLPSGLYPRCKGRLFHQVRLDNAFSHLSKWVHERLVNCGVTEIVLNKPAAPRQNAVIERVNRTLEEMSFHQLPNTTGSNTQDPRRDKPEKEAQRLNITLEKIIQMIDVFVSNYNATPHSSLNGRTPLEYIAYHLDQNHLPPIIRDTTQALPLFERDFDVTIRANTSQGHPPSVKWKGAIYTSDALRLRGDLKKAKAFIRFNINDVRVGTLFKATGQCIGEVRVEERWAWHQHSLKDRQMILKLSRKKILSVHHRNPVAASAEYLRDEAKKSKKARNKLAAYLESTNVEDARNDEIFEPDTYENNEEMITHETEEEKGLSFDDLKFG